MNPKPLLSILLLTLCLSACVTQKQLEYMQDKNKDIRSFKEADFPDYKLKPNDELYIQVSSLDEAAAGIFAILRLDPKILEFQIDGIILSILP